MTDEPHDLDTAYLNVRLPGPLNEIVLQAAELKKQNKSAWVRRALYTTAKRQISAETQRTRVVGGGFTRRKGRCTHPLPARRKTVTHEVCGICGTRLEWLV